MLALAPTVCYSYYIETTDAKGNDMRLATINNEEMVIQANVNKKGDWEKVQELAEKITKESDFKISISAIEEREQWVHLGAVWDHYQAGELKNIYQEMKAAL